MALLYSKKKTILFTWTGFNVPSTWVRLLNRGICLYTHVTDVNIDIYIYDDTCLCVYGVRKQNFIAWSGIYRIFTPC